MFILTYSSIDRDSYDNISNFWVPEIENFYQEKLNENNSKNLEENNKNSFRNSFKKILGKSKSKNNNNSSSKSSSRANNRNSSSKNNNTSSTNQTNLSSPSGHDNNNSTECLKISVPTILCSTKIDLRDQAEDKISFDQGEDLKNKIGAKCFVECSALTQENVKAVFDNALLAALQNRPEFNGQITEEAENVASGNSGNNRTGNNSSNANGKSMCDCVSGVCSVM